LADLVIRNVQILDGDGAPAFEGDVSIEGDRIAEVGVVQRSARQIIDGQGLTLSPGFIDVHTHDDFAFVRHPDMSFKLAQGVTTCVCGNCGFSAMPGGPTGSAGLLAGPGDEFADLEAYFDAVISQRPAINAIMLAGHNTIRTAVMGLDERAPTAFELTQMQSKVRSAMEQGACGFSTGLIYRPGRWARTDEVIALAREAQPFGGLYATHMRNEGDRLLEAVEETLTIGREAGLDVHISHHKSAGIRNWGKVRDSLARVDRAKAAGQSVTLDVYPYTAGSGRMIEYFNLDRIDADYARVIRIANCPAFREYEGRMVADIAADEGVPIEDIVRKILTAEKGERTICIQFIIDEADIDTNLRYPTMMVGSDGIPDLKGKPHPRLFGTFPKILSTYVREKGVLTLEDAVARMTSISADRFGLTDRGRIAPGKFADLVLFDPKTVRDLATYDDPKQTPAGISLVAVNGQIAWRDDANTSAGAGKMLRYQREAYG
jgi:N-acyl-D-aspartate/D-glutamate deacylase